MSKYIFLVMVNATDDQDDALNTWLDEHHIAEVLQTPGFVRAERFELASEDANNPKKPHRYMHFYEIETDDLASVQAAMTAGGAKRTATSPALDLSTVFTAYYKRR